MAINIHDNYNDRMIVLITEWLINISHFLINYVEIQQQKYNGNDF